MFPIHVSRVALPLQRTREIHEENIFWGHPEVVCVERFGSPWGLWVYIWQNIECYFTGIELPGVNGYFYCKQIDRIWFSSHFNPLPFLPILARVCATISSLATKGIVEIKYFRSIGWNYSIACKWVNKYGSRIDKSVSWNVLLGQVYHL